MRAEDWQRIEGGGIAVIALVIAIMTGAGWPWWLWLVVFLLPDLAMVGYLAGPRIGAAVYNAFHLYACGLLVVLLGMALGESGVITFGLLWLVHIGVDRACGFGLKQPEGFEHTHLGRIGRGRG
ncbi:DUF4260 domain-containing protein [Paracoccus aminophilus]|uniref:DUF4260 domain-containing protein n=1 Tax=Paracoccus aminophilus JCM 7686 TaxID=1367847 RepID=S5XWD3_PARAH|nr:DUF4260 domain-containing protein [Paracoccus aminophilus]AGT09582.1 hypothetical protein JCM7686_2514 [Paracoccus aminophilus JCM 7686]